MTRADRFRAFLVAFLPRRVAVWLWETELIPLGRFSPHILGRMLGGHTRWDVVHRDDNS